MVARFGSPVLLSNQNRTESARFYGFKNQFNRFSISVRFSRLIFHRLIDFFEHPYNYFTLYKQIKDIFAWGYFLYHFLTPPKIWIFYFCYLIKTLSKLTHLLLSIVLFQKGMGFFSHFLADFSREPNRITTISTFLSHLLTIFLSFYTTVSHF